MYTDQQYKELYNLNEYQIKAIKKRMFMDFDSEKNKKTEEKAIFSKSFRNNIDVFIEDLLEKGVKFYALTFNLPDFRSKNWEVVHRRMEELITYSMQNIEMIEFMYLSIEKHTGKTKRKTKNKKLTNKDLFPVLREEKSLKDVPHIHCVMGVRNFLEENTLSSIREVFNRFNDDTKVDYLNNFKNIKSYWNYVVKENNFNFHRFVHFSKFFDLSYGELSELEVIWGNDGCYGLSFYENALFADIKGIEGVKKSKNTICINLLNLYFWEKKLFLSKNEIYTKIQKSRFSYSIFSSIDWIDKNNIQIFVFLKQKFYQQLKKFKIDDFLIKCWEDVFKLIVKKNQYLPYLEFSEDTIEFTDGLYILSHNYFFDFNNNSKMLTKITKLNCYKFFDKTYSYCKNVLPSHWLSAIAKTLKANSVEDFCSDLGRYFNGKKLVDKKKKTLCIVGKSNTGKTTYVANIISMIAGEKNIGIIGKGDSFAFEQIEDKKVIVCDEFEYRESARGNLLKTLDGDPVLLDKKGEQKKLHINDVPILFMFNTGKINKKMLTDQSFINRLLIYTFTYEYNKKEPDPDIKNTLKQELPQIMIYCNNLFFEKNKKYIDDLNEGKIYKYKKKELNEFLQKFIA